MILVILACLRARIYKHFQEAQESIPNPLACRYGNPICRTARLHRLAELIPGLHKRRAQVYTFHLVSQAGFEEWGGSSCSSQYPHLRHFPHLHEKNPWNDLFRHESLRPFCHNPEVHYCGMSYRCRIWKSTGTLRVLCSITNEDSCRGFLTQYRFGFSFSRSRQT